MFVLFCMCLLARACSRAIVCGCVCVSVACSCLCMRRLVVCIYNLFSDARAVASHCGGTQASTQDQGISDHRPGRQGWWKLLLVNFARGEIAKCFSIARSSHTQPA